MRSTTTFHLATLFIAITILVISCSKDSANNSSTATNNKSPFANAGRDTTIRLPVDRITLDGSASYDPDGTIKAYSWKQISGAKTHISDPKTGQTAAYWIIPDVYYFELEVIDDRNLSSKDTLKVTVLPPATMNSPYIKNNLTWVFPWYNTVIVPSIYSNVPQGRPLRVFIQRDSSPTWIEAYPATDDWNGNYYEYFIGDGNSLYSTGSLYVFYYGSDTDDTPNVKVEF